MLPECLLGSWLSPGSPLTCDVSGVASAGSQDHSDPDLKKWFEKGCKNNRKMLSKMVSKLDVKSEKIFKKCKKTEEKDKSGNHSDKNLEVSRNKCLESLILTSTPTRNRSFHFSSFRQTLSEMVAEGLRNEGLKVPLSFKTW